MKQFLFLAERANLTGKIAGAFGSHTHSGESAPMIFDTMQYVFKMDTVDLGALNLTESMMETDEGAKACQQYGKALTEKFGILHFPVYTCWGNNPMFPELFPQKCKVLLE